MKMTKKLMLAAAVLAAASFGFMGCGNDDDDPEGAITGSNNGYTVYYDNTSGYAPDTVADTKTTTNTTKVYRAWKRTTWEHLGALTKITFKRGDSNAGKDAGVMGFAWDLQKKDGTLSDSDSDSETFNVVGVRNNNGTLEAYVSRYYNVVSKQNNNFGATGSASSTTDVSAYPEETHEYDVSRGFQTLNISAGSEEEVSVWVDVAVVPPADASASNKAKCGSYSTRSLTEYTDAQPGAWVVAFYSESPKDKNTNETKLTPVAKYVIAAATDSAMGSCYAATANTEKKIQKIDLSSSQKKQAVYTNIYNGHILSGEWTYEATYFLADVVED